MKLASLRSLLRAATAATLSLAFVGCASLPPDDPAARDAYYEANDPLEPINRAIFGFNEAADILILEPAANSYRLLVPDPLRDAVQAFILNLLSPLVIANELLQGNFEDAQVATGRFITNTVLGAGGIADVATVAGMPYEPEDFGQTLGVWGIGSGPYIVLPILGPSNLRDATGRAVDTVADPVRIWAYNTDNKGFLVGRAVTGAVDTRSRVITEVNDLRRNSVDYYAAVRSLYRQQRQALINDSAAPQSTPEFPDFKSQ
ncbi:MlaA family lipoprotein [Azospirillum halopraeferens]|uniref:MlaA family lipoprotein n=1 Tax=Azospirillum halopraeferens TaxID=34010 RepID=UPI00048E98C4|nr:VacJ family lipoprotein [Azospirillum halopraeferens]